MGGHMGGYTRETGCRDIETKMLQIEEAEGTGRVRIRDFYRSYLNDGRWQFQERVEFLRHLGALDESNASEIRIMIPNYLYMHANCWDVSSSLYSICCFDKCELRFAQLEEKIQAPYAAPEEIIGLVAQMPTSQAPGGRTMTASLSKKLQEVASHHGGQVPLHGRLFAQWMHFAFPRDCAYPRVAGAKAMTDDDWAKETGVTSSVSNDEAAAWLAAAEA